MKKVLSFGLVALYGLFVAASPVHAHVVVKPNTAGVGAFQTFTVGVPNEKEQPTTALRLVIPEGLKHVSPNVKPGWTVAVKKEGEGETARVTEISWTKGSIPVGQRDEFLFSAQVPSTETVLGWKAYQTYEDGTIVSWDQSQEVINNATDVQKEEQKQKNLGPQSETKILNDLVAKPAAPAEMGPERKDKKTMGLSVIAILLGGSALALQLTSKRK